MTLTIEYDDPDLGAVDITGAIKWGNGDIRLTMTAEQGATNTDTIVVQDPDGIYNFKGLRNIWATETEADPDRIWTAWVWARDIERGEYYRTGAARVWNLQVQDINHRLDQYVMAGNDNIRPAETDVERVQWLLGTGEAVSIDDESFLFTDAPVDMDANPDPGYNGQYFRGILDDAAQQSGKNYWLYDAVSTDGYTLGIWYGHDNHEEFASEATISNVLSEVDNVTVFWADVAAKLTRDPSRIFSGVFGNYDGGWVYRNRNATSDEFGHRDTIANWPNVKTTAKANARADRMLLDLAQNGEEDAVTVTIYSMLPSQANIFRAGHRVNGVKFTHFPGWENGVDVRIVRKTLIDQSEQFYAMEMDLLPIGPSSTNTCALAVSSADITADSGTVEGPTGYIVPVDAFPAAPSVSVGAWLVSSATGFLFGPGPGIESPWTILENIAPPSVHTVMFSGYHANADTSAPPDMECSDVSSSGGNPGARGIVTTFRSSGTSPVQSGQGSGSVVLGAPPTAGNILHMMAYGETSGLIIDSDWTVLENVTMTGFTIGVGGLNYIHCIRCVGVGESATISTASSSFTNGSIVSEWVP